MAVDARVVHEQVAVALIGGDEAVALLVVEPLDGASRHFCVALFLQSRATKCDPNHGTCCFLCRHRPAAPLTSATLARDTAFRGLSGPRKLPFRDLPPKRSV